MVYTNPMMAGLSIGQVVGQVSPMITENVVMLPVQSLPINTVPNTRPPRFKWRQMLTTPDGPRAVEGEGTLPPSIEGAVKELISMAKQLIAENADLRVVVESLAARVSAQSELLSKRAEKPDKSDKVEKTDAGPATSKKGKG